MTVSIRDRLTNELKALVQTGLYFTAWLGALAVLKKLVLEEYRIEFHGLPLVLMGILVLTKVVLILEKVPLGAWTRKAAAWVEVAVRTALYSVGVLVVLVVEKAFEGRHEFGGFAASLRSIFDHVDINHVWVTAICLCGALLVFNVLSVIRRHLGEGEVWRLFVVPLPDEPTMARSASP